MLQQDVALCNRIASLLVSALHRTTADALTSDSPPECSPWHSAILLVCALLFPPLTQARAAQLAGSSGAAVLESTAQMLLHLPSDLHNESSLAEYLRAHHFISSLLAAACEAQLEQRRASSRDMRRLLHFLVPLLPRLGPLFQLAVQEGHSSPDTVVAICLDWAGILTLCPGAYEAAYPLNAAAAAAVGEAGSGAADPHVCSLALSAAAAALRLLPRLLEASQLLQAASAGGAAFEAMGGSHRAMQLPQVLAQACLLAADAICRHMLSGPQLMDPQVWSALQGPVWEVHAATCQLLHWSLGGSQAEQQQRTQLLSGRSHRLEWVPVARLLNNTMSAATGALHEAKCCVRDGVAGAAVIEEQTR